MNILFLNSAKRGWGGNEKWTRMATIALSQKNRVFFAYRDHLIGERFPVQKFRLPFLAEIDPITIAKLMAIIRKEKIDILVPTKRKGYVLAGIAAKLGGASSIMRLGIDRPIKNTFVHRLVYDWLTDGIIVNAEKIRNTLLQAPWLPTKKVRVIYNGLDREELDNGARQPWPKPFPFTLSAVGSLTPRKGYDYLIRSFATFLSQAPNAEAGLVIAGDGLERHPLESLARKLGIADRVRFEGFQVNPYPIMKGSDVFVSASQSEGLSNALIESMYLGCVPVSTRSGGADEIIRNGENGILLNYGDESQMAAAIMQLYRNPDLRETLALQAEKNAREQFSMAEMERSLIEFFTDTLSNKK